MDVNQSQNLGDFFLTTNEAFYHLASRANFNVVLQDAIMAHNRNFDEDDGSLSILAGRQDIEYINVETQRGNYEEQYKMLEFVNRFYSNYNMINMRSEMWKLNLGDTIDLVAPSSAVKASHVQVAKKVIEKLGFVPRTIYAKLKPDEFGYSNTIENRQKQLYAALSDKTSKAVWAIKGGAGASNLLPYLLSQEKPDHVKPFIGYSDGTAVHLFLNTKWKWPSIHGVTALYNSQGIRAVNGKESIINVKNMLLDPHRKVVYQGLIPLN